MQEFPKDHTMTYEQTLGYGGEQEILFNRKR